jgi:hypothetical protein
MIKQVALLWEKNKNDLREAIKNGVVSTIQNEEYLGGSVDDYKKLIRAIIKYVLNNNDDDGDAEFNTKNIVEIDNGDYQGTLLFMFHVDTYQPSAYDYIITTISYGSCSGCDALQGAFCCPTVDAIVDSLMSICLHLCQHMKKPYLGGWYLEDWDEECQWE